MKIAGFNVRLNILEILVLLLLLIVDRKLNIELRHSVHFFIPEWESMLQILRL